MRVAVVMGSLSDLSKVEPGIQILKKYGVKCDVRCLSAHRTINELEEFIKEVNANGTEAIIAAAGMAAALPGVIAAYTTLPVIGVPIKSDALDGMDALLAIAQMPPGIPVATVAINGSVNAAVLAAQIMATKSKELQKKLKEYKQELEEKVEKKNAQLQEVIKNG
jgi:5-(carboxyamino)imidazole ribonucleotide mutase